MVIVKYLILGLMVSLIQAFPATASELSLSLISQNLSDQRTRVQRDAFWAQHKGKRVSFQGRVTDVKPKGWIMPMTVEMSTRQRDLTISCQVLDSNQSVAGRLSVGDNATCVGTWRDYLLLFGGLSLTIADATIQR